MYSNLNSSSNTHWGGEEKIHVQLEKALLRGKESQEMQTAMAEARDEEKEPSCENILLQLC